jgi:hypothetical protein
MDFKASVAVPEWLPETILQQQAQDYCASYRVTIRSDSRFVSSWTAERCAVVCGSQTLEHSIHFHTKFQILLC